MCKKQGLALNNQQWLTFQKTKPKTFVYTHKITSWFMKKNCGILLNAVRTNSVVALLMFRMNELAIVAC